MNIAVDFDGTLCYEIQNRIDFSIGPPRLEVIDWVKRQKASGHVIVLWTVRQGAALNDAIEWSRSQGIVFDVVAHGKICCDVYIDDKSMRPDKLFEACEFRRA